MGTAVRREFILEGLDCANCAAKIETKVNELDCVNTATMNFVTKTLTVEVKNSQNIEDVVLQTSNIVKKLEPDVIVKEKLLGKTVKKNLILEGLDCANCAAKIENEVTKIDGVKSASIDFISKKLAIEIYDKKDLSRIIEQASNIAKRIESDIKVVEDMENKPIVQEHDIVDKRKMLIFGAGAILYFAALLLKPPFWVGFSLYLISYILVGGEVVIKAAKNIIRGQVFDENFLMALATIGAFSIKEFPEGVAVMLFYQIGEFFQDAAVNRSRKSITALMDIRPDFATLKIGNEEKRVSPEEVAIGDIIIVKPGEKVPLDGKIIDGKSMVDTSALTGESVPRDIGVGDDALSGFINKNGLLTIEVTKEFSQSTVSKILDLVQNASSKKAKTENFITKFARYYTPVVVIAAVLLALIPPIIISGASFSEWLNRALVFLVVSCPCALVVSIPLSFFGGIGGASKNGILVKGSNYLEALNNVETIVFDKTGTLTKGIFEVTEINAIGDVNKNELLEFAAYAESYSNHPIATSILKAYDASVDKSLIEDYDEISGHGVKATIKGKNILAGNAKLMAKENIDYMNIDAAGTIVHLAVDGIYAGYVLISDEVKEDSARTIKALKSLGIKNVIMLTGDSKKVGESIGKGLGLDMVYTELLPDQKVEKLEMLDQEKSSKGKLIFVGDGINDAPVLARADVGVAMGGLGSDAAIEAADVVLMTDEPSKLVNAIKIAKRTRSIVWQNIIFALGVKLLVLLLGAIGIATMWEAVFADVGVALIAVLNSMRAMKSE